MAAIAVVDLLEQPYDDTDILQRPLGGTQSAVLETCIALAHNADTTLYNGISSPRDFGRLRIRPNSQITLAELAGVDWIVFASWVTEKGLEQLPLRKGGPKVALWAHHDIDQPAVRFLDQPLAARVISRYLFVSRWQRDRYVERFRVATEATTVIGNPYCERALAASELSEKVFDNPRLIYTSTPFRGLAVLADAFPMFRRVWPDAELAVLSGMELYGVKDNAPYQDLFEQIQRTPGASLVKPSGKIDLYRRLWNANLFAFPSTFPETFCIAALEARVLGNPLLLTTRGALPEIFEGAKFFELADGDAPAPEEWAQFMLRAWEEVRSEATRAELLRLRDESRTLYAPASIADRLMDSLLNRSLPRSSGPAATARCEAVSMTPQPSFRRDPGPEFNVIRECRYGTMIFNKNDWSVGFQLLNYGEWAESEMALLGTLIGPGSVVVDVGAHIGCHSLFFARCVGSNGHVHAFEPQRILFQTLCGNMAINSLQNVTCHPFALGAQSGTGSMQPVDYLVSHNAGMAQMRAGPDDTLPIPVRTLDSIPLSRCDLIKIDVEGMERSVLEGGAGIVRRFRPYIYAENNQPQKSGALLEYIRGHSYTIYRHMAPSYNPDNFFRNPNCDFKHYLESNILCVPAERAASFVAPATLEEI